MKYEPSVSLNEVEQFWTMHALYNTRWNKAQAAKNLGITIKTLYNHLHRWGVPLKTPELSQWFFQKYSTISCHVSFPAEEKLKLSTLDAGALPRGQVG